jgi:hypothetical protein
MRLLSRFGDHAMTNSTNAFFAFSGQKARSRVRNCWLLRGLLRGRRDTLSPACTIITTLNQTVEMLAIRGEKPASAQSSL